MLSWCLEDSDLKISLHIRRPFLHFSLKCFDLQLVEFGDLNSVTASTLNKTTKCKRFIGEEGEREKGRVGVSRQTGILLENTAVLMG